jgi:mRNA interferase HicA
MKGKRCTGAAVVCGGGRAVSARAVEAAVKFRTHTTELFTIEAMNSKQMKRWLEQQGATFEPGKGSHLKVFLNGRQSTLPMHGTTELGKGLEAAIKRQLGLK